MDWVLYDNGLRHERLKYSHQNLFVIIYRLPSPLKVFLQQEHHTELLAHL